MKILVTGGYGMVGSAIDADIHFAREDCDLTDREKTEYWFKKLKPEGIIHCAGKVGGIGGNSNFKGEYFLQNLLINTNVIEAARLAGVKRLVAYLSTCVFPDNVTYPLTIDQIHTGEPHSSNYPYAYAKRMADVQIRAYREQYGLNYTSIIPSNIYGPNDNFDLETSHFYPALIKKIYLSKLNNKKKLYIWGTGKAKRELMFVEDFADAILFFMKKKIKQPFINIGTGKEHSILWYAKYLMKKMKVNLKVQFDKSKPDGMPHKCLDISIAKQYGWKPIDDLDKGFELTFNHFKKQI